MDMEALSETQRLLGKLDANIETLSREMGEVKTCIRTQGVEYQKALTMIAEDRASIRVWKFIVLMMTPVIAALGLDWWHR